MAHCKHISEWLDAHSFEVKEGRDIFSTGFTALDKLIGGFRLGELVTVAGRPLMGKTQLCLSLVHKFALEDKIPTAIFNLETSRKDFISQITAHVGKVPCAKLMLGKTLSPEELERKDATLKLIGASPLYVNEPLLMSGKNLLTIKELSEGIEDVVSNHGVKMVFVLGFNWINKGDNDSWSDNYREAAVTLRNLAHELNISMVVSTYFNRFVEGRCGIEGKFHMLSDFKDYGDFDEVSDMVLGVLRPSAYHIMEDLDGNDLTNRLYLGVMKTNMGIDDCIIDMEIDRECGTISNVDGCASDTNSWNNRYCRTILELD